MSWDSCVACVSDIVRSPVTKTRSYFAHCAKSSAGVYCPRFPRSDTTMTDTTRKRRGRPPAGTDGDRVVDYPQLALRVPPATFRKLQALTQVQQQSQWRMLAIVLEHYVHAL